MVYGIRYVDEADALLGTLSSGVSNPFYATVALGLYLACARLHHPLRLAAWPRYIMPGDSSPVRYSAISDTRAGNGGFA